MSCLSLRINRYLLAVSAQSFKSYNTVSSCEQCVIRAAAYVLTRVDVSSSLTNENVSGNYCLTVSTLTPSLLASESRPFLVEPIPFLCAKNCIEILIIDYTSVNVILIRPWNSSEIM